MHRNNARRAGTDTERGRESTKPLIVAGQNTRALCSGSRQAVTEGTDQGGFQDTSPAGRQSFTVRQTHRVCWQTGKLRSIRCPVIGAVVLKISADEQRMPVRQMVIEFGNVRILDRVPRRIEREPGGIEGIADLSVVPRGKALQVFQRRLIDADGCGIDLLDLRGANLK